MLRKTNRESLRKEARAFRGLQRWKGCGKKKKKKTMMWREGGQM